jgi:hypothetical protein
MSDDSETNGKAAAVYVGWTTFKTHILDGLTQGGLPTSINRSVWPGQSGGVQAQLLAAVKFLGLVDDKGKPTKTLHDLTVEDESTRKQVLAAVLRARYAAIFTLDVERTNLQELTETMASTYNVGGDTKEKAVRFFLSAAQYAEIQLSKYLKVNGSNSRRRPRRPRTADPAPTPPPTPEPPPTSAFSGGSQHTINLASGGSVSLAVSLPMFKTSQEDRAFVFGLVDQLTEYEKKHRIDEDDEEEGDD